MERVEPSAAFPIGTELPHFSLRATDGKTYTSDYLKTGNAALVVFSCNHCPYVKGSDSFLISVVKEMKPQGLLTVAINSNDPNKYPDDTFEKMKEKASTFQLPYPYLVDDSQVVAKLFDAQCTPECYLFDGEGKLAYHGKIVDTPRDPTTVREHHLKTAIVQLLESGACSPSYVHPMGCSIKWR